MKKTARKSWAAIVKYRGGEFPIKEMGIFGMPQWIADKLVMLLTHHHPTGVTGHLSKTFKSAKK